MKEKWLVPQTFVQEYLDFCRLASTNDEVFKRFKDNDRIRTIIENTPEYWAKEAIFELDNQNRVPKEFYINETPTMVRYYYAAHLINKFFGIDGHNSIIEIGAGYGGMCKVLNEIFLYDNNIKYTLYDLLEPSMLQKRFLSDFNINPIFKNEIEEEQPYDLLISWCAWGELSRDLKELYAEKVISKSKHFFIGSNYNVVEDKEILDKYFTSINIYSDKLSTPILWK